jgi:peptidoglycan hydrolase-like protein with peptidoglycan-binding domain
MRRSLSVKNPMLEGPDVLEVQVALGLTGTDADGVYGPNTAFRVQEWKWQVGFPADRINGIMGLPGIGLLLGTIKFPADFLRRATERQGKPFAPPTSKGIVRPLPPPVPRFSEFQMVDAEGAPDKNGVKHHAALDWFDPAGTVVRAPVAGTIVEAKPAKKHTGQVFGGTTKIQASDKKVWTFRHVVPSVSVGMTVTAGQPVAAVSRWDDGPEHSHIEIWKTLEGSYQFENMLDPLPFFR